MDRKKFNFAEMVSNSDGKTSGSGTMGCLVVIIGCIGFLVGVLDFIWGTKEIHIMSYSTGFVGAGSILLGYRKSKAKNNDNDNG